MSKLQRYATRGREFLSEYSEKHAAVMGFVVAFALGMAGLVAVIGASLGVKGLGKITNRKAIRELQKEPWYAMGAGFVGYLVNHFSVVQSLPF